VPKESQRQRSVHFTVPPDVYERLDAVAQRESRRVNHQVRHWTLQGLERDEIRLGLRPEQEQQP
jgi:hypothetical protein